MIATKEKCLEQSEDSKYKVRTGGLYSSSGQYEVLFIANLYLNLYYFPVLQVHLQSLRMGNDERINEINIKSPKDRRADVY